MAKLRRLLKMGGSAIVLAIALSALNDECKAESALPLMMVRLRAPHTESDGQWAKTFNALHENRGACDEVWFSTGIGFPKIEWHEEHAARLVKYAEELRAIGIVPRNRHRAEPAVPGDARALRRRDGRRGCGRQDMGWIRRAQGRRMPHGELPAPGGSPRLHAARGEALRRFPSGPRLA